MAIKENVGHREGRKELIGGCPNSTRAEADIWTEALDRREQSGTQSARNQEAQHRGSQ